uniref:Nucleolar protein 7 n=1 Tax=Hucho hucho TaxID=62062 RepID=A0A4W5NRL4_9TELE
TKRIRSKLVLTTYLILGVYPKNIQKLYFPIGLVQRTIAQLVPTKRRHYFCQRGRERPNSAEDLPPSSRWRFFVASPTKQGVFVWREKDLLKEKRRKRQELFQEQKKRRLLPAHVLEEIDTAPSKKQKLPGDQAESNNEEASEGSKEGYEKETKEGFKGNIRSLKGKYNIMRVADQSSTNSQQQTAMDFIQARLYGPGSQRTTNNKHLSLQNKRGPNKSAAVQFVNKKWGTEKKAKAEKLKKQWIHKHKVPSS